MEVQPREIQQYKIPDGKIPFSEWLESLRDFKGKAKIVRRLERVSNGNLGDARSLGEGVWEFRIDFGPGYRVYFGQVETTIGEDPNLVKSRFLGVRASRSRSSRERDARTVYHRNILF
ncbi:MULTISPECIES: type II toxin-antitoxin system RelE/ParE family toxin [unclassified Microcoleus]